MWREFRSVFRQQEQMKTFPQYDGTEVKQSQWGRRRTNSALKKEANWIPFIRVGVKKLHTTALMSHFLLITFIWQLHSLYKHTKIQLNINILFLLRIF